MRPRLTTLALWGLLTIVPPAAAERLDLELGGGLLLFSPSFESFPRGSSDTAVSPVVEVSLGVPLSSRITLRGAASVAGATETEWSSASEGGTAIIPTPSSWSLLLGLEAPLLGGPVVPFAGVGGGLVRFGEVDERIRFEWSTHSESSQFRLEGRTDGALQFDLGLRAVTPGPVDAWVLRYRFLSVFSGDQVNTLDRITLAARVEL
jgi:hypothetical protein